MSESYRGLMEELADAAIRRLLRKRRADLDVLSMQLAVGVAARAAGLTESRAPGMARRLDAFFEGDVTGFGRNPQAPLGFARNQARVTAFFYLDVKPAIEARKKQRGKDIISHLISRGYGDAEILTECITYAAAGTATTREFIGTAAWHMLEQTRVARALPAQRRGGAPRCSVGDSAVRTRRRTPVPSREGGPPDEDDSADPAA